MKKLMGLTIVLASLNVFAGAEEHMMNQTCYVINAAQSVKASVHTPTEVCLETLTVNLAKNEIELYSFFGKDAYMYENAKLTYLARKNEDFFSFRANSVFRDVDSSLCVDGPEHISLQVNGLAGNDGIANVKDLKITITEKFSDACTFAHTETFNFELRQ